MVAVLGGSVCFTRIGTVTAAALQPSPTPVCMDSTEVRRRMTALPVDAAGNTGTSARTSGTGRELQTLEPPSVAWFWSDCHVFSVNGGCLDPFAPCVPGSYESRPAYLVGVNTTVAGGGVIWGIGASIVHWRCSETTVFPPDGTVFGLVMVSRDGGYTWWQGGNTSAVAVTDAYPRRHRRAEHQRAGGARQRQQLRRGGGGVHAGGPHTGPRQKRHQQQQRSGGGAHRARNVFLDGQQRQRVVAGAAVAGADARCSGS